MPKISNAGDSHKKCHDMTTEKNGRSSTVFDSKRTNNTNCSNILSLSIVSKGLHNSLKKLVSTEMHDYLRNLNLGHSLLKYFPHFQEFNYVL